MTKIFINPGHAPDGNPDPGAVNSDTGLRECDVALIIGNKVAGYLQNVGYEAQVLQSDSLEDIVSAANDWSADLFISIHCNAAAAEQAQGTEVCVNSTCGAQIEYVSKETRELAGCLLAQVVTSIGTVNRGLKPRTSGVGQGGLYVLGHTDMPAALIETAFISNTGDEELLATKQDEFARAIARGVTDYYATQGAE